MTVQRARGLIGNMACDLGLASWTFSHQGMLGSREEWSSGAELAERAEAALQTDLAKALPRRLPAQDRSCPASKTYKALIVERRHRTRIYRKD